MRVLTNPSSHGSLLSLLRDAEEAVFTWLGAKTESTDGNLGAQLLKLEEARYVAVEEKFVTRQPQTSISSPNPAAKPSPNTPGH